MARLLDACVVFPNAYTNKNVLLAGQTVSG